MTGKRAALLCAGVFLRMNGWDLHTEGTSSADAILDLVEGGADKAGLADWFKSNSRQRPSMELRDFFAAIEIESLIEHAASVAVDDTSSVDQLATSMQEASEHIPALADLWEATLAARASSNLPEFQRSFARALVLVALFRIAEDMGYDW